MTREYGGEYVTFYLTYNKDGSGDSFTIQGREYVDAATRFSGSGSGMWAQNRHLVRMIQVREISDGSQNLDVFVINPLDRTPTADLYGLRD